MLLNDIHLHFMPYKSTYLLKPGTKEIKMLNYIKLTYSPGPNQPYPRLENILLCHKCFENHSLQKQLTSTCVTQKIAVSFKQQKQKLESSSKHRIKFVPPY